jgi:uncharacterized protein
MKLLVVLLVVLFGVWLWRSRRLADKRPPPPPARPAAMVACDVCGVHLPQADALTSTTGVTGVYCSPAHRQQAQR